jgi:hypothetical protein
LVNKIKVLTPVFADNLAELIRGCLEDLSIKVFYQKGEFKLLLSIVLLQKMSKKMFKSFKKNISTLLIKELIN